MRGEVGPQAGLFSYFCKRFGNCILPPRLITREASATFLTETVAMKTATEMTEKQRLAVEAMEGARNEGVSLSDYAKARGLVIRELYLVERALWDRDQPISPEHRVRVRAELSAPIVKKLHGWLDGLAPKVLPQSQLGKAVHYTLGQWPKLIRFLEHGEIPLDNNRCENAIRPFVVGRKGWMFSDTVKGAIASANLFSIAETAKANGVEPHAYLSLLFERPAYAKNVEDFEALLPWNAKAFLAARAITQSAVRCAPNT